MTSLPPSSTDLQQLLRSFNALIYRNGTTRVVRENSLKEGFHFITLHSLSLSLLLEGATVVDVPRKLILFLFPHPQAPHTDCSSANSILIHSSPCLLPVSTPITIHHIASDCLPA